MFGSCVRHVEYLGEASGLKRYCGDASCGQKQPKKKKNYDGSPGKSPGQFFFKFTVATRSHNVVVPCSGAKIRRRAYLRAECNMHMGGNVSRGDIG